MRGGILAPPLTINGWLRYDIVARILAALPKGSDVVEIGAGMGSIGARLAARHRYIGVEPDVRSFEVAERRIATAAHGTVIRGDASSLPKGLHADVVCAFEVLEHIEDDEAALRQWRTLLRAGGTLIVTVPAWQHRYGPSDRRVGHYRRYDRDLLVETLTRAGFEDPHVLAYGFPLGYLLEATWDLVVRIRKGAGSMADRSSQSGRWLQPPAWLGWAPQAVTLPFRLIQRPFASTDLGTGFVAFARAPAGDSRDPFHEQAL